MRSPHRASDRVSHVLPDGPCYRPLNGVMDLLRNRAVDGLLNGVWLVADMLFDNVSDRVDRPRLQDRVVDSPHHRDLLRIVDGLRYVLEHRLTLELILGVPATLLGHRTDSIRSTTRVACSPHARVRVQPAQFQGRSGADGQFSLNIGRSTKHSDQLRCSSVPKPKGSALRSGTANSLLNFVFFLHRWIYLFPVDRSSQNVMFA